MPPIEPLIFVADPARPWIVLRNPNYVRQDGIVYGWDAQHCEYQQAWWLNPIPMWRWAADRVKREIGSL